MEQIANNTINTEEQGYTFKLNPVEKIGKHVLEWGRYGLSVEHVVSK